MSPTAWAALASWIILVPTALTAGAAARQARKADKRAAESNRLAGEANQLAAQALDLPRTAEERADRLERQAADRADVVWEHREVGDGETVSFQNIGADAAHDVRLVVDIDDGTHRRKVGPLSSIQPHDRIGIRLAAEARAAQERWEQSSTVSVPGVDVRARITWRSETGKLGVFESDDLWV